MPNEEENKMKSFATATIFAVGLGCIALGAQSTSSQTSAGPTGQSSAGAVTLVGCLQRGGAGQATAGTTGAASAASTADSFILANASRSANAASSTTPSTSVSSSSGVTAPDGSGQAAMNYTLEGNAADLTAHVGHRIEVTGTMAPMMNRGAGATTGTGTATGTGATTTGAGAATATGTGTATGAAATTAARAMSPRFTVTSVKMISADCGATR
jgi:hypothetical protein